MITKRKISSFCLFCNLRIILAAIFALWSEEEPQKATRNSPLYFQKKIKAIDLI